MKRNAIARIIIFSLLIVILSGILLSGLYSDFFSWGNWSIQVGGTVNGVLTGGTEAAEMSFSPSDIDEILILWVNGNVEITGEETDTISYQTKNNNTEFETVYKLENRRLSIGFNGKKWNSSNVKQKDLVLSLPRIWNGRSIKVEAVSADVKLKDVIGPNKVRMENVSGEISLVNVSAPKLEISTVSGDMALYADCKELEVSSVSANCTVHFLGSACPESVDFQSVSGNLELNFPDGCGIDLELDGLKKDLETSLLFEKKGDRYYCAGALGICKVDAETVSGGVKIGRTTFASTCSHLWVLRQPLNETDQSIYECQICGALKTENE